MWLPLLLTLAVPAMADADPCDGAALAVASDLDQALTTTPRRAKPAPPITTLQPDAFVAQGLSEAVLAQALTAYETAWKRGDTRKQIITVIDYSMPSSEKRLWVIDLANNTVVMNLHVAHGQGSGGNTPTQFSNTDSSHQSNVGLLKTAETYSGKHGYSLRLDGLEPGFNDNARPRAIVIHGADYATQDFVDRHGRLGRSWGCPAVDGAVSRRLIDAIKGGSLVFGYYPKADWLERSRYLNP